MSLGRLPGIGGAAELNAATGPILVLPTGCTFELAGRRSSIVDAPAGERGRVP